MIDLPRLSLIRCFTFVTSLFAHRVLASSGTHRTIGGMHVNPVARHRHRIAGSWRLLSHTFIAAFGEAPSLHHPIRPHARFKRSTQTSRTDGLLMSMNTGLENPWCAQEQRSTHPHHFESIESDFYATAALPRGSPGINPVVKPQGTPRLVSDRAMMASFVRSPIQTPNPARWRSTWPRSSTFHVMV